MATYRVFKTDRYGTISTHHIFNTELSLKAKGLLSQLLCLPENWDYSAKNLETFSTDGVKVVYSGLVELEKNQYLIRNRVRSEDGTISDWEYLIFETPEDCKTYKNTKNVGYSPLSQKGKVDSVVNVSEDTNEFEDSPLSQKGKVADAHNINNIYNNTNTIDYSKCNKVSTTNKESKYKYKDICVEFSEERGNVNKVPPKTSKAEQVRNNLKNTIVGLDEKLTTAIHTWIDSVFEAKKILTKQGIGLSIRSLLDYCRDDYRKAIQIVEEATIKNHNTFEYSIERLKKEDKKVDTMHFSDYTPTDEEIEAERQRIIKLSQIKGMYY